MDPQTSINPLMQIFPFLLMFLVFYVLVLQPRKKEQNEKLKKLAGLKKNDAVVTAGGIHGIVVNVKEHTVIVRVDDSVRIEFDKTAIAQIIDIAADN